MKPPIKGFALASFLATASLASAADLTSGLVSYWPMESLNGDNTTSDQSFANHLSASGSPSFVPGTNGNSLSLTGTSLQYLSILHTPDPIDTGLPIFNSPLGYTVSFWVKAASQAGKYVFTEGSTTSQNPLFCIQTGTSVNGAKVDILIRSDANTTYLNHVLSVAPAFDNTWHHVAWTDQGGTCKLYIDGNLDSSFAYTNIGSTFSFNTTAVGALVRAAVGGYFTGLLDEVCVWERVLPGSEVLQLVTSGIGTVVPRPPAFLNPPASITRNMGDWAFFSPRLANNRPFTYQWYKNGLAISDATNRTYRAVELMTNNSGDYYSLAVTNPVGGILSSNAVITILADPAAAVTSGLLSYWPLDTVTNDGTTAWSPDLYSGNDMVLNAMDASSLTPAQFADGLMFDGLTQYASRNGGAPASFNTNYSISLWVKGNGAQMDRRVFSEGNSTNGTPLFTIGTDSLGASQNVSIYLRNDANNIYHNARKSTRTAFDDAWHHLVWTDANGQAKLYIDGVLDETDYSYTRKPLSADRTSLGAVLRGSAGNWFNGAIDEAAMWNRVLSWTEIQSIRTNGIPKPAAAIPPSILAEPADLTNAVFQGDTVAFTVLASGSSPLTYSWRKKDIAISPALNATAVTNTLVLTNVQTIDNAPYSVLISNVAGSVTSHVAQLTVTPYIPATAGEVLNLDVGPTGNLQPGFAEFGLAFNSTNYNGVKVSVSGIGTSPAERVRVTDPWVTNNPPDLTQAQIYNDFIFANNTTIGTGLRILIERLAPNTRYALTIWSFDANSAGDRLSDWTETALGTPVAIQNGYTFNGDVHPANDYNQVLGGILISSPSGKLQIEGVRSGGTSFAVFFNGLRLVANPSPTSRISKVALQGSVLRLQVLTAYPGQPVNFERATNLVGGTWEAALDGTISVNGDVVTADFPASGDQVFYRCYSPAN